MKKYLQILGFAFKEQLEYRRNFFFGITTMVINDAIFLVIFAIFLSYFTGTGLTFGNFMVVYSLTAFLFGIVNGLFANIGGLSNLIEEGKMDYYLSFPVPSLGFLAMKKISMHSLWDTVFACILMTIYTFTYWEGNSRLFMIKWLVIMLIASIFVLGLYLLVNSISFRLQRGSRLKDLFESFFIVFGAYPPDIFLRDKLLFILISCIGLYPAVFLPYRMIVGPASIENWILLIVLSFAMFALWVWVFHRGLKKYTSGNLVLQM